MEIQNGEDDVDSLDYKIKLFYTKEGLVGKTFLEVKMEGLTRYDKIIEIYESVHKFYSIIYEDAIDEVINIKKNMDRHYYKFYDEYRKEGYKTDSPELKQLREWQHDITTFLTEEIMRRKRHLRKYRRKYYLWRKKQNGEKEK